MGRRTGGVIYTQMLNPRGGIEADVTFCHLAEDRYYMVTDTGYDPHDLACLRRNLRSGAKVTVTDVTSTVQCFR